MEVVHGLRTCSFRSEERAGEVDAGRTCRGNESGRCTRVTSCEMMLEMVSAGRMVLGGIVAEWRACMICAPSIESCS